MLASLLQPGDVVALVGNLGAGKTHLVQAIAVALGVPADEVTSPTFVLIQEYAGRLPVCHIDAYRLADTDEFLELGADELLAGECVALIEWADRVAQVLPRDRLTIALDSPSEHQREFRISAGGRRSEELLAALAAACA
jgi:tRNA threonylcarbamoyladenosine biosynthesis protein TsaE